MRRCKFLPLAGGAAITWPLHALAQQSASLPVVAVLIAVHFANGDIPKLPDELDAIEEH